MSTEEKNESEYSEKTFWDKVAEHALDAGKDVISHALTLYYTMQRDSTPMWAKSIIVSALAYFILPIDAVPDIVPVVGYVDDLGALAAAYAAVAMHISEEDKEMAKKRMKTWFGENCEA
ncbi:hypothetical protein DA2_1464 [Desulfovibrio sp. A2]|nr:hypothetical protein DA2_1464 [Desulfovibrio sp. A2]